MLHCLNTLSAIAVTGQFSIFSGISNSVRAEFTDTIVASPFSIKYVKSDVVSSYDVLISSALTIFVIPYTEARPEILALQLIMMQFF